MKWFERDEVPTNWLENLVSVVEEYDPDFASRLRGASDADVDRLEALVRERKIADALPSSYRAFLLHMGRAHGGLLDHARMKLGIEWPLEYYELLAASDEAPAPEPEDSWPKRIDVGPGLRGAYDEVVLELTPQTLQEPKVVEYDDDGERVRVIAGSLPRLLFQQAWNQYVLKDHADVTDYNLHPDIHSLRRAASAATEVGFTAKWFCDEVSWCGWAQDVVVSIHQPKAGHGWFRVAGNDREAATALGRGMETILGAKLQGKKGHSWG